MLPLQIPHPPSAPLKILCIGAHSDDIEIGCGGTVYRLLETYSDVHWHWVVVSSDSARRQEAEASARTFLASARQSSVIVEQFRERYFPFIGAEIKKYFDDLGKAVDPDLILTHSRHDLHQDHRTVSELTWHTFRDHLILEYEIPKYDGDLRTPNCYVPLSTAVAERKIMTIMEHFASQAKRRWFRPETFWSLLRLRGIECNAEDGLAEAFHARKLVL